MNHNDSAVVQTAASLQKNITRFHVTSITIKGGAVAAVVAFLGALMITTIACVNPFGLVMILIMLLLWLGDSYYLSLERKARCVEASFLEKLNARTLKPEDLFRVFPRLLFWKQKVEFVDAAFSLFTFPLYATLIIAIAKLTNLL